MKRNGQKEFVAASYKRLQLTFLALLTPVTEKILFNPITVELPDRLHSQVMLVTGHFDIALSMVSGILSA